ncbi:hypothetical protein HDU91_004206, partial [Kappamyces sp. JEL0680]
LAGDTAVAPRKVLVYEWMSLGQLSHQLAVSSPFSLLERMNIALQIATTITALHDQQLYHSQLSVNAIYLHRADDGGICAKIGNLQHLSSMTDLHSGGIRDDQTTWQNIRCQTIMSFGKILYQLAAWKIVDEETAGDTVMLNLNSRLDLDLRIKNLILACLQTNVSDIDPTLQTIRHQLQEILRNTP